MPFKVGICSASQFRNDRYAGIVFSGSSGGWVSDSKFEQNQIGIVVQVSSGVSIANGSIIDGNDQGILVQSNSSAKLRDSMVTNNTFDGVRVEDQGFFQAEDSPNTFLNNGGFDVSCAYRGIVTAYTLQIPDGGAHQLIPAAYNMAPSLCHSWLV